MNGATPRFWQGPLRYFRWAARERPGYFWACFIGSLGPAILFTVPPLRRRLGDPDAAPIPMTYPGTYTSLAYSSAVTGIGWRRLGCYKGGILLTERDLQYPPGRGRR
jgi:hypothetical protein